MQLSWYVMGREYLNSGSNTGSSSGSSRSSSEELAISHQNYPTTPNSTTTNLQQNFHQLRAHINDTSSNLTKHHPNQENPLNNHATSAYNWLIASNNSAPTTSHESSTFVRLNHHNLHHQATNATTTTTILATSYDKTPTTRSIVPLNEPDVLANVGNITQTTSTSEHLGSDPIVGYVDLSIVRSMFTQYIIEIAIISVILIYLFYYFRRISQCPRLIGNESSDFFKHIKENLGDVLSRRFSPLIYFWGTNPQTALFGYLQGNSSEKEMPRSKFKRQYLYVSDVQYLTSNVNLNEYYPKQQLANSDSSCSSSQYDHNLSLPRRPLVQLNANDLLTPPPIISLLDQNIRLALESMARSSKKSSSMTSMSDRSCGSRSVTNTTGSESPSSEAEESPTPTTPSYSLEGGKSNAENIQQINNEDSVTDQQQQQQQNRPRSYCDEEHYKQKPLGSSSGDSGVFASNSSSSSSSASSLTINLENSESRCNCLRLYEDTSVERFDFQQPKTKTMTPDCDNYQQQDSEQFPQYLNQNSCEQQNCSENNTPVAREKFEFGQCALDWYQDSHRNYHRNKLVALISAGMTTGSDKKYVTDTVTTLSELGYEVCVFIRRGVGGLKLSSARFFSPSKWRDFEAAIHSVRRQRPNARLVAIGFSFGSIELCRYLSMSGERSLVESALLVSCPFDPEAGGRNMRKRALNRRIDAYLAKNLGKQLYQALFSTTDSQTLSKLGIDKGGLITNQNGSMIDLALLPKIKSLVDFEDNYNRVIQNYPNSRAYAEDSRLHEHLKAIKTPTLCLSSEDDFMAPLRLLPLEQIKKNKNICMILTKRGGHMAFVDGLVWPKKPYFAQRIIHKYMGAFKLNNSWGNFSDTNDPTVANYTNNCEQQTIAQKEKSHHIVQVFR